MKNVENMGGGVELENTLLDQAIFSKILPKIRGQQTPELEKALIKARQICNEAELISCSKKLDQMISRLQHQGITRFWA